MKTIKAEIPDQVYRQIQVLVQEGWFKSEEDIVEQALSRFLNSHRPDLLEKFVREDVDWGIRGGK